MGAPTERDASSLRIALACDGQVKKILRQFQVHGVPVNSGPETLGRTSRMVEVKTPRLLDCLPGGDVKGHPVSWANHEVAFQPAGRE